MTTPDPQHDDDVLSRPLPPARVRVRVVVLAAVLDLVVVLAFAAVGRSTHGETIAPGQVLETAWPFLVALVAAWAALGVWRRPMRPWPFGVGVWALTWGLGMALRAAAGGGTALAFVLVALGFLGLGLVGWRLVAALLGRSTYPGLPQD